MIIRDIINEYARFRVPFTWGTGKSAIADGTHHELYENNLIGKRHIRYGGYGGIAYHHISDMPLRREIRAATTKIESYNSFTDWIFFGGGGIITSRAPVEYEKRIKYKDLIANAIMLQNVADMTDVLHDMLQDGYEVTADAAATFSPYLTEHLKRFGEYVIDLDSIPSPLQPDKPFLTPELVS